MKLTISVLTSMLCMCATANLAAKSEAADNGAYTTKDSEYYLTANELNFIRPGLELEVIDVVIPDDRKTEVTFRITDPAGLPLDRSGVMTPGPVSTSFILSYIPAFEESYVAYTTRVQTSPITNESATQASTDSGGSYTDLGDGTYMYKFGTEVPTNYDMDVTHTMGMYARRDLREFDLDRYVANELDHFVPSGVSEPMPRDIVSTETCNGRCHDPLALHGGARQEVGLCVLCHNASQSIDPDTGNSVDMPLMIHKIHMGANLTKGYNIIGYRQTDHDYSHVEYPAPINECEVCHTGGTPTENFPMVASPTAALVCDNSSVGETTLNWEYTGNVEIKVRTNSNPEGSGFATGGPIGSAPTGKWVADGTIFDLYDADSQTLIQSIPVDATVLGCVGNAPGTARGVAAMQHTNWLDHPSRVTCGSCHDDVNFETGEGHSEFGIIQPDDAKCGNCHEPVTGDEFDRSVTGAHISLYQSKQFPGVRINLLSVANTGPGQFPTVTFSIGSKSSPLYPGDLNRLLLNISGPNDDFSYYNQENVGANVEWADGNWTYTFQKPLPITAMGSYTVAVEGRNTADIDFGFGTGVEPESDQAENSLLAFAVTDDMAVPRRTVVEDYKCESCHSNLSLHGDNRKNANYCVTCHMPDALDSEVRPDDEFPAASIHFKYMIHKIHRGQELEKGYVVYGYRGSLHDFSEIEYSGDLRNCDACHVGNSQQVDLPAGLLPTRTPQEWWDPMMPQAAACLSCHDDDSSAAHAYSNTTFFGESCSTCHGEGKVAAVDKVHAQ
jgi:hypothetical protein